MRVPGFAFPTVILLQLACSGSPVGIGGEGTVTLDLSAYQPGHVPSALSLANQTLAFPLVVGPPSVRAISEDVPGDLQVLYTRVGCWVDPDGWIGSMGTVPVELPATPTASVNSITIDHLYSPEIAASLAELADETCVSVRGPDGVWGPFLRPDNVAIVPASSARVHFSADGRVGNAVAIFVPTYTYVSQITYAALAHE
jgi:hypothetical protein